MPRLPIDYSKTIIYKICCNDVNITDVYVGHTTDLIRRRRAHKFSSSNESNREYNYYKYKFIRENGGWDNWCIVPVEEYPCENVNQARIRERYWIEELKAELNKQVPSRAYKEYREDNKEKIKEKDKRYRENNKEMIKEKQGEKFNCECGCICRISDKARHLKTKKHQNYITSSATIIKTRQESSNQTIP